jgi:phytoene dehydrogenase-like protein
VIVGSGPNGLAAALTLAREGFRVTVLEAAHEPGGGTRTYEDPAVPGLLHDHCSAVHPLAAAGPFLKHLPLDRFGLRWCRPELDLVHPMDDGTAGIMQQDLGATVAGLGVDGPLWDRLFGGVTRRWDALSDDLLGPILRLPRHPFATSASGIPAALPASVVARGFTTPAGTALFGGIAAHAVTRLDQPLTSAVGLLLGGAGHITGWPVAEGGSQAIWRAMVGYLRELGGEVVTNTRITDFAELPRTRVALFDTTPTQLSWILGERLPAPARRRAERWRYGPGAFKVDFAIRGAVPWTAEPARRAATLHLGGTFDEIAAAEAAASAGTMPDRPFTLVSQPHVADPTRAADGITPLWTYAHVPHGSLQDAAPLIEAQIERFAPGFQGQVVARHVTTPADFEAHNPNLIGGDIGGGANSMQQLLARPRPSSDPYATAVPGVYLCSSSTPPGGGVHGMAGFHAARSALRVLTA